MFLFFRTSGSIFSPLARIRSGVIPRKRFFQLLKPKKSFSKNRLQTKYSLFWLRNPVSYSKNCSEIRRWPNSSEIWLPQQYHSFWVILLRVEFGRVWPPRVLPAIFLVSRWILHPKWLLSWKKIFFETNFFSSKFWNLHFTQVTPYRNMSWKSENIEKKLKKN